MDSTLSDALNNTDLSTQVVSNITFSFLSPFEQNLFKASYYIYNNKYGFITSSLTFLILALTVITYASFASLRAPKNAEVPDHKKTRKVQKSKSTKRLNFRALTEGFITERDAFFLPLVCACNLGLLYYAFKYFKPTNMSLFLNRYVLVLSVLSFHQILSHTFKIIIARADRVYPLDIFFPRYKFTLGEDNHFLDGSEVSINYEYTDLRGDQSLLEEAPKVFVPPKDILARHQLMTIYVSSLDMLAMFGALGLTTLYYFQMDNMNWLFSNLIAYTFAFKGIALLKYSSLRTGVIVLAGLFFYDIYFVFHSDMMVSVAKSIQIPVLLQLPSGNNYEKYIVDHSTDFLVPKLPLSMLGLGDIVVPGAFIAFCMRYDLYKYHELEKKQYDYLNSFKTTYFSAGLISYVFGLTCAFVASKITNAAQPALLYLSPSLAIGVILTAYLKGELKDFWKYIDYKTDEEIDQEIKTASKPTETTPLLADNDYDYDENEDNEDEDETYSSEVEDDPTDTDSDDEEEVTAFYENNNNFFPFIELQEPKKNDL